MNGSVLVTGSHGCIGAWTLLHLVRQGRPAVAFDLTDDRHRLDLLLTPEQQDAITFVRGDLTDAGSVRAAMAGHGVSSVVHLAALQVPFCRANPALGARVNVEGTVNVFEAARAVGITHLALASSVAVYGPPSAYSDAIVPAEAPFRPGTLYGVYKQANEATARVYHQDHGISSITLRPYTVYGLGRDQGMTSEPTKAMLAAAAGKPFHIGFAGRTQFHLASDVARWFLAAADTPTDVAVAFNLGGPSVPVARVAAILEELVPGNLVTVGGDGLPFPDGADAGELGELIPSVEATPLEEGIRATVEGFRDALARGLVTPPG